MSLFGAALLGMGLGSEADVVPYLLGQKHFSVIYGLTWTAYAIGGATGPLVVGHLFDRAGSYEPRVMLVLAGVALLAGLVSLLLHKERSVASPALEAFTPAPISLEE